MLTATTSGRYLWTARKKSAARPAGGNTMSNIVDLETFRRRRALLDSSSDDATVLSDGTLGDLTDLLEMIKPLDNLKSINILGICPNRLDYLAMIAEDILSKLDDLGYFEEEVISNDNDITEE